MYRLVARIPAWVGDGGSIPPALFQLSEITPPPLGRAWSSKPTTEGSIPSGGTIKSLIWQHIRYHTVVCLWYLVLSFLLLAIVLYQTLWN